MDLKLVFIGPPGAGKGTQASRMAAEFGLRHASTGDIFREAAAAGSELGKTVSGYLDAGRLVPDELTSRVVREMVLERFKGYILDGYPRTVPQAESLERMLEARSESLDAVVYFELGPEEAVKRLTGRLVCPSCNANYHRLFMPPRRDGVCDRCGARLSVRSDSSEEVVERRLSEYNEKTRPLAPYYESRSLLRTVDASQDPDSVACDTRSVLVSLGRS